MFSQLKMEIPTKVLPAAAALVEALRVAGMIAREDVPADIASLLETAHGQAQRLATDLREIFEEIR